MKANSLCSVKCGFLLLPVLLVGCAGSPFSPYSRELSSVRNRVSSGDAHGAFRALDVHKKGRNSQLYLLETGRINHMLSNYGASKKDFAAAIEAFKKSDDEAVFTVTGAGAQTGALLINDAAVPYKAEPYERIFVYHYQALNFLMSGEIEKAGVEIRRALYEQRRQELRYDKELREAQDDFQKSDDKSVGKSSVDGALANAYAGMDQIGNLINSSLVNPYLYFLAGIVQELDDEESNAFVSYRKAIHSAPKNRAVQEALMKLAHRIDRTMLQEYEKKFDRKFAEIEKDKEGELIVLYEQGFVPMKEEVSIPFPTGYGITTVAFPIYNDGQIGAVPLKIFDDNKTLLGQTDVVCNVQAIAYKALREKMAVTAVKTVLRVVGKVALQRQAAKEMGDWGEFLSSLWNIVSERADTRSWATLPANAQVFRTRLPVGERRLFLNGSKEVAVNIRKGRKTLIVVNMLGSNMTVRSVNF